jgi:hypothetical protein
MAFKEDKPKNKIHANERVITEETPRDEVERQKQENAARIAKAHQIANKADEKAAESEEVTAEEATRVDQERIEALSAEVGAKKSSGELDGKDEDELNDVKPDASAKASGLNEDGLIPGAPVDFETIQRINAQRNKK